jgi:hypothetical protein
MPHHPSAHQLAVATSSYYPNRYAVVISRDSPWTEGETQTISREGILANEPARVAELAGPE